MIVIAGACPVPEFISPKRNRETLSMNRRSFLKVFGVLAVAAIGIMGATGFFQPKSTDILIVTGNYVESRLLAEVAQYYNKHPVLLYSPEEGNKGTFYLMGAKSKDAFVVKEKEFNDLVFTTLMPKTIIFLGDSKYIPQRFSDRLRARNQVKVLRIESGNWQTNAEALSKELQTSRIAWTYKTKLKEVLDAVARQTPDPVVEE
jgi:hypothetical protein